MDPPPDRGGFFIALHSINDKEIAMSIRMRPGNFPDEHRQNSLRRAEARVFDALQNLKPDGHGIYEFRFREGGAQLDFALWVNGLGRFALQVKGGSYRMDGEGRWYLGGPDGDGLAPSSPLDKTEQGCIEMHDAIDQAANVYGFVASVLVLPDMEPDERMERAARNHKQVHIIWGLNNLEQDLERIAGQVRFKRPPKPRHSENECRRVFELQFSGYDASGPADGDRPVRETPRASPRGLPQEQELTVGSATFNIQHVDTLVLRQVLVRQDDEGLQDPEA